MVNILFVDDEQFILQSIKRTIRSKDKTVYLASSGEEGLELLKTTPIDIVVSDVRMPNMDGIAFLQEVRCRYPNIYRLILSGYVDREAVLKAILSGVAFEYLTKPWEKNVLREKIAHIVKIREKLSNQKIIGLINQLSHLPKDNKKIKHIEEAIDQGRSLDEITGLIIEDLSTSTKILQMVNSALYSHKKVSSIREAIDVLGLSSIRSLILASIFVMEDTTLMDWQQADIEALMSEQCQVNAAFSNLYYKTYETSVPDECSTLGLVYNIGKILTVSYFPDRHKEITAKAKEEDLDYYEAELALGYDGQTHQEIGAYFLDLWNFSRINVEASLFHHNTDQASIEYQETLSLLKAATEQVRNDVI